MSINISDQLKGELLELKSWIQNQDKDFINDIQETILVITSLITDEEFRLSIKKIRQYYKIPLEWQLQHRIVKKFNESEDIGDIWFKWHEQNRKEPFVPGSDSLTKFCFKNNINLQRYGLFISNYIYFASVKPIVPPLHNSPKSLKAYRRKARLEIMPKGSISGATRTYIRFYKDTTKPKLISFIEDNWNEIELIKSASTTYPQIRKFENFKRDIQIYILHLLGNNAPQIGEVIYNENVSDPDEQNDLVKEYSLDEPFIRQIIKNIKKQIENQSRI